MSRIILGVAGGIAAYKACELLRRFTESGHDVTVVPTESALNFVGAATWAALSGKPVHTGVWEDVHQVPHVALGKQAELVVIAPATADLMARAATGRADDLLTNILLTARCPVVFAPAMHTEMWQHPATVANVDTLRSRGAVVIDPDSGRLTGADTGPGRLPDPAEIFAIATSVLDAPEIVEQAANRDLSGLRIAISAGGTREYLDPVRFLGNSSSGRMGFALARAAVLRGASVTVVAANVSLNPPAGVELSKVTTTAELGEAMTKVAGESDVVIMSAAPADYTSSSYQASKIKKTSDTSALELSLTQTEDILAGLVRRRTDARQVIVGFAAETPSETQSLLSLGQAKLAKKGCDLLVLNAVGRGKVFDSEANEITLLTSEAADGPYAGSKDALAHQVLDAAVALHIGR